MKYLNIPVDDKFKEALDKFSKESGVLQKKIIVFAVLEYIKKHSK